MKTQSQIQGNTCWWVLILSSRDNTNCFHVSTSGERQVFKDLSSAWQYLKPHNKNKADYTKYNNVQILFYELTSSNLKAFPLQLAYMHK